jgi:acyl-CoA thioester hydrolase
MAAEHTIEFRVRYDEADRMGVVHHSRYLAYFEMGRVELMRAVGLPHLAQEERGQALALRSLDVRYCTPARYDDTLRLATRVDGARGARVVFKSHLTRVDPGPEAAVAEATVEAAAVRPDGAVRRLTPEELAAFNGETA